MASALIRAGVAAERIQVQSYGEASPAVPTGDGVASPQNRRVVVRML